MSAKQPVPPRSAGVLMGIHSLPSRYGIGHFGAPARRFLDFLVTAGQRVWQVLPLGHTGYGFSPYQCFSAFAGTPYFIDLDDLAERGWLTEEDVQTAVWDGDAARVAYAFLEQTRLPLLEKAYGRLTDADKQAVAQFAAAHADWIDDYALFMALKDHFDGKPWQQWPVDIALREDAALAHYREVLADRTALYTFVQYLFFDQWSRLRADAAARGVKLMGDIPIYVAMDSADAWAHRDQFLFDEHGDPLGVAGVPPDYFSVTGQRWGNPLYDWDAMEKDGFSWWQRRIRESAALYDMIRIDHFIGLVHYYVIPPASPDATVGEYRNAPTKAWLAAIRPALGNTLLIAEDLGNVTPQVQRAMKQAGLPGMRVLQFGFDACDPANIHLPHRYEENMVVYTGTHDNPPIGDITDRLSRKAARFARGYLQVKRSSHLPAAMIRSVYASVASIAMVQMQDVLGLGDPHRTNTPGTVGNNWWWRLTDYTTADTVADSLKKLAWQYERLSDE